MLLLTLVLQLVLAQITDSDIDRVLQDRVDAVISSAQTSSPASSSSPTPARRRRRGVRRPGTSSRAACRTPDGIYEDLTPPT